MYSSKVADTAYNFFKNFFREPENKSFILDPLSVIIRLGILSFKPRGCKISINDNKIRYNEPCIFQGPIRWSQGDAREDLHNLYFPIIKALSWYDINNPELNNLFKLSVQGLEKLKESYTSNTIIAHSIQHYIKLINDGMQRDQESKNNRNQSGETLTSENNHIFETLKKLWNEREIIIVTNLLLEIKQHKKDTERINNLMSSLDYLIDIKEKKVTEIIKKTTTSLE